MAGHDSRGASAHQATNGRRSSQHGGCWASGESAVLGSAVHAKAAPTAASAVTAAATQEFVASDVLSELSAELGTRLSSLRIFCRAEPVFSPRRRPEACLRLP